MTRRVTMREIASAAGVSTATVSRALGVDPRITEDTRRRVRDLAESLGYRVSPLLSAYARQRRGVVRGVEATTLAYVTNFPTADEWRRNPFYARLFSGASAQARQHGYKLEHFWMREPRMTAARFGDILHSRGISGLCIAPTPVVRRLDLDWSRFCCVTIGYSLLEPLLHRTAPHHFEAVLDASRRLWNRGYTRIGLCLDAATSPCVNDLWLAGALLTGRHNPSAPLKVFLYDETSLRDVPAWMAEERLQAVLSDDTRTLRSPAGLRARERDAVDYVTLNWIQTDADGPGINQRPDAIGAAAIDQLVGLLQRGEFGVPRIPVTSMIDGEWVEAAGLSRRPAFVGESL